MPFRPVPVRDRTLHRVLKRLEPVGIEADDWLWRPGDPADRCVHVLDGTVAVVDRRGRCRDVIGAGELGGTAALGETGTHENGARALTPCRVAWADAGQVLRALRRGRRTLPLLLDALRTEGEAARATAAGAGRASAESRLAATVLELDRRFGDQEGALPGGLTHRLLGEIAGLHRSTVTTLLNDWLYHDLLSQTGRRLEVADREGLWALSVGESGG